METWKCKWCHTEKALLNKYTKSGHLARCQKWIEFKTLTLTKQTLETWYLVERRSLPEIAEQLGLESVAAIHNALKEHGIKTRSVSESRKEPRQWKRYAATSIKNSGVCHNFKRDAPSRLEWQKRLLETENVINVFQRKEVKTKARETLLSKYGVENPSYMPRLGRQTYTKPHRWMVECLQEMGFSVLIELKLATDTSFYSYDILIDGTKKLIEVNGDYWHANPQFYKPDDRVLYGSNKTRRAAEIWEHDATKLLHAKQSGYDVLVVWQHDIEHNPSKVKENVVEYCDGISKNKINQKSQKTK
jgi:G:T-mismatch repair DNA endonuclease (very short patch repair protein)